MIFRLKLEEYASLVLSGSKTIALGGFLQATSCFASGLTYTPLDMAGQPGIVTASAVECQQRCASVAGCAHFSYWPGDKGCHLQDFTAVSGTSLGAQSGPPACEQGSITHDVHTWISASTTSPAQPLNCIGDADSEARGSYVSCPQIYASGSHIAQLLSLVVNVRDGVIHSFAWDNSCDACGPQRCMNSALSVDNTTMLPGEKRGSSGTCGSSHVQCADPQVSCDLQILVTWAGTDKDGRHLQSAGRRLSQFGGNTMSSLYETMDYYGR